MNRAAIHPYFGDLTRQILECAQAQQNRLNRRVATALKLVWVMDILRQAFTEKNMLCHLAMAIEDAPTLVVLAQDRDWTYDELLQAIGIDDLCKKHSLLVGMVSRNDGLCRRIYTEEGDGPGFDIYLLPKE